MSKAINNRFDLIKKSKFVTAKNSLDPFINILERRRSMYLEMEYRTVIKRWNIVLYLETEYRIVLRDGISYCT
jgi:hypothetical protein